MSESEDKDEYEDMEEVTTSTNTRWTYIGTVLAGLIVTSLPVVVVGTAAGVFSLTGIPQAWFGLYLLVTLMAATWAFGKETLEVVNKARGK